MGKKYKFRATASRQARIIDRCSILPDEIAHHILSFLNFTDRTRVGTVSKKCRQFYLSIPSVDFDQSYDVTGVEEEAELLKSLDRYLFYRGDNRIQRFRVRWSFIWGVSEEHLHITTWIHNAIRCNAEVLDLYFGASHITMLTLPPCVFLSQSLRSLSVCLRGRILQVPSSSLSCNLLYLKLSDVKIVDESFCKWISVSCKCIKELQLIRISGIQNITIESTSLESFKVLTLRSELFHLKILGEKLEDIHIVWKNVSSSSSKSLSIFAPNLKKLKWEGNSMNSQHLGRFMSLEKAVIFMESEANDFDNVYKLICSICRAEVVILNERTTKALFREGSMLAPLVDICNLGLHLRNLNDEVVPAVVSLLGRMPNLNSLHIECIFSSGVANYLCAGCDVEYWKLQRLAFIHQLKEATLELSNGSNAIEFARYILEHAPNLEKMVIFHLLKYSDVVRELDKTMISNARVVSQVRKAR